MFLFRSAHRGRKLLNAILPPASCQQAPEQTRTDLEILQRFIELGAQLAELAAIQVHEEAACQPGQQSRHGRADPNLVYFRHARLVHDTITLKARLQAGILGKAPRPRREPEPQSISEPAADAPATASSAAAWSRAPQPISEPAAEAPASYSDPRRPQIIRYVREAAALTSRKRKIPLTPQAIEASVTAELEKDTLRKLPGQAILLKICKSLDLPFYANRLPTDLLRPPQPLSIGPP